MLFFLETDAGLVSSRFVVRLKETADGFQVLYMDGGEAARLTNASRGAVAEFLDSVRRTGR